MLQQGPGTAQGLQLLQGDGIHQLADGLHDRQQPRGHRHGPTCHGRELSSVIAIRTGAQRIPPSQGTATAGNHSKPFTSNVLLVRVHKEIVSVCRNSMNVLIFALVFYYLSIIQPFMSTLHLQMFILHLLVNVLGLHRIINSCKLSPKSEI